MDRFDDDNLFAELRALRPKPRPEFAGDLDERAAAGFPRRQAPSAAATPFALLVDRWRAMSPRRRLMPVLAVVLGALVVATAVVAISQSGPASHPVEDSFLGLVESGGSGADEAGGSGQSGEESVTSGEAAPSHEGGASQSGHSHHGGRATGGGAGGKVSGETVYEAELPSVESRPQKATNSAVQGAVGGTAAAGGAEEGGGAEEAAEEEAEPAYEAEPGAVAVGGGAGSPSFAAGNGRDIERSAYVVLGTKPGGVSPAAARVFEAVHAANGVVLHSKVQSGSTGATGAYFELLIPSGKLDDALSAFSQIAEVRERHDATNDITAPTVGATEELRDSNAAIEGLLKELGDVETEAERESVEARLREERRRHAVIRASLDHLNKRASMSEVTVRIVSDHGAGVTPAVPGNDSWGVGDALHDAGHILTIAAGVLLIGLAVLAPIALIALAFWLANRFRVRRLRERTLG